VTVIIYRTLTFSGRAARKTSLCALVVLLWCSAAQPADKISETAVWQELNRRGLSFVFGRFEGKFVGPAFHDKKIRLLNKEDGEESTIEVDRGLGYFYGALPAGAYSLVSFDALYVPPVAASRREKYPPVRQRYLIKAPTGVGRPSFRVVTEMPLYLGTIRIRPGMDGSVYKGNQLAIIDEYEEAVGHLGRRYPNLARSLSRAGLEPGRSFILKPENAASSLEPISADEPIALARDYIEDGKYRQAIDWLMTFMPASDKERNQVWLLNGEALLGELKYQEAIEVLGRVLLEQPENQRALRLLARAHAYNGDVKDAFDLYEALSEVVPGDAESALYIGYQHALRYDEERAAAAFDIAFEDKFDYLLYDNSPFVVALESRDAVYSPPSAVRGVVKPPETLRSRRGSEGALGVIIDHKGNLVAAHMTSNSENWAPSMIMSVIRASFKAGQLNGVPVPCVLILGSGDFPVPVR